MKNKILIGIDGNEANLENRVGVNKYAFEIVWSIYKLLPDNSNLIVWVYLKHEPLFDMPKENAQFKYKILRGGKVWILTKLMPHLFLTKEKPQVFFTPSHYLPPFLPMPAVCSIMDLGYLEFSAQFRKKDYWQLKWWTARSISISKYIMTISNATREDIVRQYPDSRDKVVVTYPGYDDARASEDEIQDVKARYSIVNDYILYLGTLKPSKNIEGLIEAWGKIVNDFPHIELVIGGKKGWLYETIFKKVAEMGLSHRVLFTDFVPEEDKAALIKGAKAFILPSFWEGFGLDVLTAYALGVPVIAANVGSLPEVVGDAGIMIDPNNTNSIAEAIAKTLNMKRDDYAKMVEKEKEQLKKFSWKKTAEKTLEVLEKTANDIRR